MAQKTGAGPLKELLVAQQRIQQDDGYGNPVSGPWTEVSRHSAAIEARRGTETVVAGRLQGVVNWIATVRYSGAAAAVTTEHRFVDDRSGAIYAIKTAIPRPDRKYIDFDLATGVADG